MTSPSSSYNTAVDTLTGIRSPLASIYPDLLFTGFPLFRVRCRAQSPSHMLDLNTSEQSRPNATLRGIPVISSAARLKEVTGQSGSTVNTPSEMVSSMAPVRAERL